MWDTEDRRLQGRKEIEEFRTALAGVAQLVGAVVPETEGLQVQFLVRAHAQVAGPNPGWVCTRRQLIDVSLSFPFSH